MKKSSLDDGARQMEVSAPLELVTSKRPCLSAQSNSIESRTRNPRCQNTSTAAISTSEMIAGTLNTRLRMPPPFLGHPQRRRHDAHGHHSPHRRHDQVHAVVLVVGEAEELAREGAAQVIGGEGLVSHRWSFADKPAGWLGD